MTSVPSAGTARLTRSVADAPGATSARQKVMHFVAFARRTRKKKIA